MIHEMDEDAVAAHIHLQVSNGGLKRGELPELVIRVYYYFDGQVLNAPLHFIGIMAENHDNLTDRGTFQSRDDSFDEGLSVDRQQRLWPSHAAGFTGGENDSNDHVWIQQPICTPCQ